MEVSSIVMIVITIAIVIYSLAHTTPTKYAKGIAKAQLKAYETQKELYPELSKSELYVRAISTRPGLSDGVLNNIKHESGNGTFRSVVHVLVSSDYAERMKKFPDSDINTEMWNAVDEIIPEHL